MINQSFASKNTSRFSITLDYIMKIQGKYVEQNGLYKRMIHVANPSFFIYMLLVTPSPLIFIFPLDI